MHVKSSYDAQVEKVLKLREGVWPCEISCFGVREKNKLGTADVYV